MKKLFLFFLACGTLFLVSCYGDTVTGPATVVGFSDTTKLSDTEKEQFGNIRDDVRIVDVTLKEDGSIKKAAITQKNLAGKTFPFSGTYHSGDGLNLLCGCPTPYID